MIESWGPVLLFAGVAVAFAMMPLLISAFLRPHSPNPVKLSPYECGVDTIGPAQIQFRSRYYLYALIFVLFDVEALFFFPWAVAYQELGRQMGALILAEMGIFIGVLILGLAYAWRKGALEWV